MLLPRLNRVAAASLLAFLFSAWALPGNRLLADIADFSRWHLAEDPPNDNLSATNSVATATLFADGGPVPPGTDIGYGTINGDTAANSTAGFVFGTNADFEIAIDFQLDFTNAQGALGLGFGVGEESDGANSVGVGILTNDGGFLPSPGDEFFGAARINDVTQDPQYTGLDGALSGSLFVAYEAATGSFTVGASATPGASAPESTTTFTGLQQQWPGNDLSVAFFIRSEEIPFFAPNGWEGGQATAQFSNFRVLTGSWRTIPEPTGGFLLAGLTVGLLGWRTRRLKGNYRSQR